MKCYFGSCSGLLKQNLCFLSGILLIFCTVLDSVSGQDFGYDGDKGPAHWGEQYNTCFGKHQSPININSLTVKRKKLPALIMDGFKAKPELTTLKNNGHTVMITIESEIQPTISGGPLNGVYEFSQMHFHWGDNDTMGSEDLIDGRSFPMELHMVFYKKQYRNVRSAMDEPDGLSVLAFFYEIDEIDNKNYLDFTNLLLNVTEAETNITFRQKQSLSDLIPKDVGEYFTYNGSLTTPPCSEVVTWIDFKQPIPLSHKQIDVFRSIRDDEGHKLTHNFRPIQPLGDRVVWLVTNKTITKNHNENDNPITEQELNTTKPNVSKEKSHSGEDSKEDGLDSTGKKVQDVDDNSIDTQTKHPKNTGKKNSGSQLNISHTTMFLFAMVSMLLSKKFLMF